MADEPLPAAPAPPPRPVPAPPAILELPATRVGAFARDWLAANNSGDPAALRAFLPPRLSQGARDLLPADEWLRHFQILADQSGGLDVVALGPPSPAPHDLAFTVRSRRHDRYARMRLILDDRGALADAFFHAAPHPGDTDPGKLEPLIMPEPALVRAISRRIDELAAADRFSGAAIILKGDRLLLQTTHGLADRSSAAPNRIDTKFNLGSMNKMFTAVAIAQLAERGELAFTDPIIKHIPDYPDQTFAAAATIHHLLTHTSGVGGTIFPPEVFKNRDRYRRPADYLPLFAAVPPQFPPGERFAYANPGFMLLGLIVERVSGEPYDEYVRRHIFIPAGMPHTAAHPWDAVVPDLAVGYTNDDADPFGVLPPRPNVDTLPYAGTPAGGGYSTALDLLAFARALRGHRLLGPAYTELVTTSRVDAPDLGPGGRYGYGFTEQRPRGKSVRGHSGGAPGINAQLDMFWDGSYTVVVVGNRDYPNASGLAAELVALLAAQDPG